MWLVAVTARSLVTNWSPTECICCKIKNKMFVNTIPVDALATLVGASVSEGMVLTPKAGIFHLQHQKGQFLLVLQYWLTWMYSTSIWFSGTVWVANGTLILFNVFLMFLDLTGKPAFLLRYKIQDAKEVPVSSMDYTGIFQHIEVWTKWLPFCR